MEGRISEKVKQFECVEGRVIHKLEQVSRVEGCVSERLEQLSGVERQIATMLEKLSGAEAKIHRGLQQIGSELGNSREKLRAAEGRVDEVRQGVSRDLIGVSNTVEKVRREMGDVGRHAIVEQDVVICQICNTYHLFNRNRATVEWPARSYRWPCASRGVLPVAA